MLGIFVKTAYRNLLRNRLNTAINMGGLAVALAAAFLILVFVGEEISFDRHVAANERIYMVKVQLNLPGMSEFQITQVQPRIADDLATHAPNIEAVARLWSSEGLVEIGSDKFLTEVGEIDPSFLDIFPIRLIEGGGGDLLPDISALALTETSAQRLFGDQPAVGQQLVLDGRPYRVSAVIADLPPTTHLNYEALILFDRARQAENFDSPMNTSATTYMRLPPGADPNKIEALIPNIVGAMFPDGEIVAGVPVAEVMNFSLVRLPDVHFSVRTTRGDTRDYGATTARNFSETLTIIAFLIVIVASFNYISLATAAADSRSREIAVRKTMGAKRSNIFWQFMVEAQLLVLVSGGISLALAGLAKPYFEALVAARPMNVLFDPQNMALFTGILILVGLLAGLRPALVLARKPLQSLVQVGRSAASEGTGKFGFTLVIAQFAGTVALVTYMQVASQQVSYSQHLNADVMAENLLFFRGDRDTPASALSAMQEVLRNDPDVTAVSRATGVPGDREITMNGVRFPGQPSNAISAFASMAGDENYFRTLGIPLIAGRSFGERIDGNEQIDANGSRWSLVVVNQTAAKAMGFPDAIDALGARFFVPTGPTNPEFEYRVIGVVPDIHVSSARVSILPTVYQWSPGGSIFVARYRVGSGERLRGLMEATWLEQGGVRPLDVKFMDQEFAEINLDDRRLADMIDIASLLALLISGIGLFGLTALVTGSRTREISIRKVLGATTVDITRLLTLDMLKPVLIACILSWPIAWIWVEDWLKGFAYRIELSALPFALAALGALTVALLTVTHHAIRTARTHPAEVLRYE